MLLHLHHKTHYQYSPPVENAHHVLHLQPINSARQSVLSHSLQIEPVPDQRRDTQDVFGNHRTFFSLHRSHPELCVNSHSVVQTHSQAACKPHSSAPWESTRERYRYRAGSAHDPAWQFVFASPLAPRGTEFADFALASFTPGRPLLDAAHDLMQRIHHAMEYDADATEVDTQPLEALRQGKGVCQDFAHIMVACCRAIGLPARYVSGYMLTQPEPGQPRLIGCDASHAWASVFCPDVEHLKNGTLKNASDGEALGQWLDFDPTNNRVPLEDYITLATGRDYLDLSPLRGVIRGGAQHTLSVAVTVTPVDHATETLEVF